MWSSFIHHLIPGHVAAAAPDSSGQRREISEQFNPDRIQSLNSGEKFFFKTKKNNDHLMKHLHDFKVLTRL